MDVFSEKELIDNVKSIAKSLEGIKLELADVNDAIREAAERYSCDEEEYEDDEEEEEGEEDDEDEDDEDDKEVEEKEVFEDP